MYDELKIIANLPNYPKWIYSNIKPFIGKRILEVGAGVGLFTNLIIDKELIVAIDISNQFVEIMKNKFRRKNNLIIHQYDISNPKTLDLTIMNFDTVICLNVLEHIDNDISALANIFNILSPGGNLILMVPAINILYGSMDKKCGHYRRYGNNELISILTKTDFIIQNSFYMNLIGILGWYINFKIIRKTSLPENQLRLFNFLIPFYSKFENLFHFPIGMSLICIGKKPSNQSNFLVKKIAS